MGQYFHLSPLLTLTHLCVFFALVGKTFILVLNESLEPEIVEKDKVELTGGRTRLTKGCKVVYKDAQAFFVHEGK